LKRAAERYRSPVSGRLWATEPEKSEKNGKKIKKLEKTLVLVLHKIVQGSMVLIKHIKPK
jgi:hypothetical protein